MTCKVFLHDSGVDGYVAKVPWTMVKLLMDDSLQFWSPVSKNDEIILEQVQAKMIKE